MQRGKNDKVDAIRISDYAFRYADKARLWQPEREVLQQLKQLVSLRKRLLLAKNMLKVPVEELAALPNKNMQKALKKLNKEPVNALEKQLLILEKKIRGLVKDDEVLHELFVLVTSVDGVGEAAAAL
ncbi:hypothetical protein GCM10027291_27720 [Telluribacter humicola]